MSSDGDSSPAREPDPHARLRGHFEAEPHTLAVLEQEFETHERANFHLALQEMLGRPGCEAELLGVVVGRQYDTPSLSKLSQPVTASDFALGPVEYADAPPAAGAQLACLRRALCLIRA